MTLLFDSCTFYSPRLCATFLLRKVVTSCEKGGRKNTPVSVGENARCEILFFLNGTKILPERDLMNPGSPIHSWRPLKVLDEILGKWYYCKDDILETTFYVKHLINNRFELWQILLGAELGNGVYKIRSMELQENNGIVTMKLDDYDQIKEVVSMSQFKKWLKKYGVDLSEIEPLLSSKVTEGNIDRIVITW